MPNQYTGPTPVRSELPIPGQGGKVNSLGVEGYWLPALDGDARARAIYLRHYSAYQYQDNRRRTLFVGPGEKMVLMTVKCDALWVWRKFISDAGQEGINCAVFRNEGDTLSSLLVSEACDIAWQRWPGERLYTYIGDSSIKSVNPGYCFKMAGWTSCGRNADGRLSILERIDTVEPDA